MRTGTWSKVLGERSTVRTRGTILFSWKQYCLTQERKLTFTERNFSCISYHNIISEKWFLRNTFWIEGIFLVESHINLDDGDMSLASAQQTQTTSTYRYCLYLRTNTMRILSSLAIRITSRLERRNRKRFFFSCFPHHDPTTQC